MCQAKVSLRLRLTWVHMRVLAPLTSLCLLWRGHLGFGGICCSPWQDCDGALTMEVADQGLVQGTRRLFPEAMLLGQNGV